MIRVFAIEPEAIFDPGLRQALENFGFHHGRLVGRVPKDWRKKVLEIYRSKYPQDKKVESVLERLYKKQAIQKVPLCQSNFQSWLEKAIAIDPERVHGIICSESQVESPSDARIISRDQLNDDNAIWNVETGVRKPRTVKEMANCIRVLLRYSEVIKFIDPHFSGELRHTELAKECLSVLMEEREGKRIEIEFHSFFKAHASEDLESRRESSKPVADAIASKIQNMIPSNFALTTTIFLWSGSKSGERFHERFVSTNRATIEFGGGLDSGKSTERTTVKLMGATAHEELQKAFSLEADVYDLLHQTRIGS